MMIRPRANYGESASDMVAEINDEINAESRTDTNTGINAVSSAETHEDSIDQTLSAPESNQRNGSTWLFVVIALVVGFAIGAGYVSHRASS